MLARLAAYVRGIARRRQIANEIDEELRFHVEQEIAGHVARGISPVEARRLALRDLGGLRQTTEAVRDVRTIWLDLVWRDLRADLRFGWRTLRRSPGFVVVAVLSLALGIGVNTAVFSVINGLLLRPLPLPDSDRVYFVETGRGDNSHSFPNYRDLRARAVTFTGLAAYRMAAMQVEFPSGPARAWGYLATGNYFDVLGTRPALGRLFGPQDDAAPGASPYVVLSDGTWRGPFGADPHIIGRTVKINRLSYTVIGVARPEFFGTEVFYRPALWVPMAMQPQVEIGNAWLDNRATRNTLIAGRLAPKVTAARAEADMNRIASALARDYPRENRDLSFALTTPGWLGSEVRTPMRAAMFGVLFLASLVLLVACANLVSLLLARGDERQRELAIRGAIGAGRWRLFRQLMTESALLAAGGGAIGCGVAMASTELLSRLQLSALPIALDVRIDLRVLVFAVFTSVVSIVLFGMMPARRATKVDLLPALKDTSVNGAARWGLRHVLVAIQVALCFAMVSASLMSLQGLRRLMEQPLGFQPEKLYTALFDPSGYDRATGTSLRNQLLEIVRRLPSVTNAAYVSALPLSTDQSTTTVFSEGEAKDPSARGHEASYRWASTGFVDTAGVRLVAGRDFNDDDTRERPRVAIVNETFARQVWQVRAVDAVGRRYFNFGRTVPISVVGVVADGKYRTPTESPVAAIFEPLTQVNASEGILVVRSASPPPHILPAIRRAAVAIHPELPLSELGPASDQFTLTFLPTRAAAMALNVFGAITLVLAATGVQGLLALIVTKRRRELAIRAAIGAAPSDLVHSVGRPLVQCLAAGAAGGAVLSLGLGKVLSAVIVNVSSMEPWLFVATTIVVFLMGVLAAVAPAVKAFHADPALSLRAD